MILDRLEFLNAIGFIKHVIPDSDDSGTNCLFIRVENDKFILTGGGSHASKKVTLVRPISTEEAAKPQKKNALPKTFMIPLGTLLSFETLMQKHKKKAKKMAKNDASYLYIDVDDKELQSFGVVMGYPQPPFSYKNLEPLFEKKKGEVSELPILSGELGDIMSGFAKSKQVQITFSGDGNPVHFFQAATEYEAILIPPPAEDEEK